MGSEAKASQPDRLGVIKQELEQLPPPMRRSFLMHRDGGATLEEVAAVLEVSTGTVERWIQQALDRIKARLDA